MSILRNLLGSFMPHFESRRASGTLAALNAELVLSVDGDESAVIYIDSGAGVLNATYNIQGSPDGTNYYDLLAYPYGTALVGGTLPLPAQALVSETVNVALKRMLCVACGGLQKIRVRLSAWTSGSCAVNINSDAAGTLHPYLMDQKAATLLVSATGVAGAAVTATLPAVTGLRHYIDRVSVVRSLTAAQVASATPTQVTTTNLPGSPVLTFGTDAGAQGTDRELLLEFGGAGLSALLAATPTTFVCPATTSVIWRVNTTYRTAL